MFTVSRSKIAFAGVAAVIAGSLYGMGSAFAQTVTPESVATSAGTSFKDTGIAIVGVLVPLAVLLLLAQKALPWARRMLGI